MLWFINNTLGCSNFCYKGGHSWAHPPVNQSNLCWSTLCCNNLNTVNNSPSCAYGKVVKLWMDCFKRANQYKKFNLSLYLLVCWFALYIHWYAFIFCCYFFCSTNGTIFLTCGFVFKKACRIVNFTSEVRCCKAMNLWIFSLRNRFIQTSFIYEFWIWSYDSYLCFLSIVLLSVVFFMQFLQWSLWVQNNRNRVW